MLMPTDIENKTFSKSIRGYNADEVDEFLDQVIMDWQLLLSENRNLSSQLKTMTAELERFKKTEASVLGTIESAKRLMTDISESAEKRAEVILKNARLDAEVIRKDAEESVSRLTKESEQLRQKAAGFRRRYRQLLEEELRTLENKSADIFGEFEREFLPSPMETEDQRATIRMKEQSVEEILLQDFSGSLPSAGTDGEGGLRADR